MKRTTRMPSSQCPHCDKEIDAATHFTEDVAPEPGDFTICIRCLAILRFTRDLLLAATTEYELNELHPEELNEIVELRHAITKVRNR